MNSLNSVWNNFWIIVKHAKRRFLQLHRSEVKANNGQ